MKFPSENFIRFLEKMAPARHDNEIIVVLTGHLLIEELLIAIVEKSFADPTQLNRKSFYDYLCLARALGKAELPKEALDAAEALNRLRNQLAHNLDDQKYQQRKSEFLARCKTNASPDLIAEFGEMWLSIMELHSSFIYAAEVDRNSLRLPTTLSMASGE